MTKKTKTEEINTEWNNWQPGSGRRGGQHNFDKPFPYLRDERGRPLTMKGTVDVIQWEREQRKRSGQD